MRLLILTKIFFFGFTMVGTFVEAKPGDVDDLYASIGARLAHVKKQTPSCATTIGSVLDDFDRMYKATRVSQQQDKVAMKELETKTIENAVLQKELLASKQEIEILKQALHEAQLKVGVLTKEVEKEREQVAILKDQNVQLQQKTGQQHDLISAEISKIDKQLASGTKNDTGIKERGTITTQRSLTPNQNLNRTSTSEPISPR